MVEFIVQFWQLLVLIFIGSGMGFGVSAFLKVPLLRLRVMFYRAGGKHPIVFGIINRNSDLELHVLPRTRYIEQFSTEEKNAYIDVGETINILGFRNIRVFYSECVLALKLSAQSLNESLLATISERNIDYTYMSSEQLGNLCYSASQLAKAIGASQIKKKQQYILYAIAGIGTITLILVLVGFIETSQIAKTVSQIAAYLSSQVSHTIQHGGSNFGIKK